MSDDDAKLALKNAILEWRKKYNVQDGDPMLAAVELWEIYFTHAQLNGSKEQPPSFEDFRSTMEQLERLSPPRRLRKVMARLCDSPVASRSCRLASGQVALEVPDDLSLNRNGVLCPSSAVPSPW